MPLIERDERIERFHPVSRGVDEQLRNSDTYPTKDIV
jgi:hypothetical protein